MRLRSRPPRQPGEGWVQASRAGAGTILGNLDSPARAMVDPAGLVALEGRSWSLDWWIGAEDRWHVPAAEVAVRQALVRNSPVVETRLRVPTGDAVHRVYAARDLDGTEALVVEVHNDTKVPFALALAIRPYGLDGFGALDRIELDGSLVRVDGGPAVVLSRSPGRFALSDAAGDAAGVVFAGGAEPVQAAEVRCADGLANGAFLFPVAHTATLRIALPLDGAAVDPATLPNADQVASGWAAQSRAGARLEVPNRRVRDAIAASTRFLLLGGADPTVAAALDLLGFPEEAAWRLQGAEDVRHPGRTLAAIAQHWSLTADVATATAAVPRIAALVPRLARSDDAADASLGLVALPALAELLDAVAEPRAAGDVRAVLERSVAEPADEPGLEALLGTASSTWTWPSGQRGQDLAANAALVTAVRHLLVAETPDGLALSPGVPEAWFGQGWEVHDLPTAEGRLGFAIRWHGDRPALLWDLEPPVGRRPARLRVPSLDPAWSSTELRGEALLAPSALPARSSLRRGLTIPVTVEPTRRGRR